MRKSNLRAAAALQALALLGAGAATAFIAAAPAAAQDYTQVTATGRVLSPTGAGIPGATVMVTSEQGTVSTVTTDGSGSYAVPALQNGTYVFAVSAPGFETFRESGVTLNQAGAANNFQLLAAGSAATTTTSDSGAQVTVTGRRIRVSDFDRTTTGAVISVADIASRVPVSRTLRDVILLAPGTTQGSSAANGAFAGQAQISGSSFTENAYYVNGLNITEFRQGFSPVTVPFDFYDTVEVKTGGFQAEFGRATGGVVNAITKSGSNTYHASVSAYFAPDSLSSDAPNTFSSDNDGSDSRRFDTVVQVSGPIIKDRLFVYGLYNWRDVESFGGSRSATTAAGNTGTRSVTDSPFWGGKIDAVPIDGQRLEFTYFDTHGESRNDTFRYNSDTNVIGNLTGRTYSRFGGKNWVGRYTGTFTDFLTVSLARGRGNNSAGTLPNDLIHPRVLDVRSGTSSAVPGTNPAGTVSTNDDRRDFFRGDVDLYFNAFGKHHVRFGYDREKLQAVQTVVPTGTGANAGGFSIFTASGTDRSGLPAGTQYFSRRFFQNGGAFHSTNEAFYAQDSWQLFNNRLTLNLGVRLDKFEALTADGQTFFSSKHNIGPRLGFSYDVFGDGRAKLFGSFGRTFVPPVSNTNIRLAGEELDFTSFFRFNGLDAQGIPIAGAPVLSITNPRACPDTGVANCNITSLGGSGFVPSFVARNAKAQYVDEYILGGEYRFPQSRWRVGLEATYRKLGRALEDAAIDQAAGAYCRAQGFSAAACDALYSGFAQYVLVNPGFDQDIILGSASSATNAGLPDGSNPLVHFTAADLGLPKAKRTYKAITAKFDREYDGVWSLSGSYTLSSLKGNYEGGAKSDIGQTDTGITQDFDQPGFTLGAYGFLPGHRRHQFKLYGSYKLTDFLVLGANLYIASPKKFGCIGVVPDTVDPFANLYGVAGNFCQGVLVPRASALESDWRKEVNLSALIKVPTDAFNANLRVDVFNVFNTKSALELREFGDLASGAVDPNYGKPVTYQTPRSVRFGVVVGF